MSTKTQNPSLPDVFEYDEYRQFLRDAYLHCKKNRRGFSFRSFAQNAGFSSPNFIKLVIDGKRNLSLSSIVKISKALKMNKEKSDYFEMLVYFNQAKNSEEKNSFYERMTRFQKYRQIRAVEKDQYEFYRQWYYSAIRELVGMDDFKEDPNWIAQKLFPKINEKEASEAVDVLLRLGLIERGEKSNLYQADATISSGPEVKSMAVASYHRQMFERASSSIDKVPSAERDISGVTLGVEQKKLPKIKSMIQNFRKELLAEIGASGSSVDRVYQLNIQLFPLTQKGKEV